MDNITELKKRYEALGEEIKKLEERQTFVPGWYMYCDNNQEVYRIEYLIREDTYANTCWDNVVPVTQEVLNKFLPKTTMYNWSKAPDWAQWAATDEDGVVCWYEEKPRIGHYISCWLPERKRYNYAAAVNRIVIWKDSLEERPSENK